MPAPRPGVAAPLVRVKTSDAVAQHLLEMVFAGELHPGDRIDLDAVAARLGVSRAPVREALVLLERDGLVAMPFHRRAHIARIDASTITEAFELYALLSALATGRVARQRDPTVLADLAQAAEAVESAAGMQDFELAAREVRRIINVAAGGPHLRALLRTFGGLLPAASRLSLHRSLPTERRLIAAEVAAIRRGDADGARKAAVEHIHLLGQWAVQTLLQRGVIEATPEPQPTDGEELLAPLRALPEEGR